MDGALTLLARSEPGEVEGLCLEILLDALLRPLAPEARRFHPSERRLGVAHGAGVQPHQPGFERKARAMSVV